MHSVFKCASYAAAGIILSQIGFADDGALDKVEGALDGSSVGILYRDQTDASGNSQFNQAQYTVDLKFNIGITADGKLRLIGRVGSGSFSDNQNNLGIDQGKAPSGPVAMKNLYIDYALTDHASVDAGALMPTPEGVAGAFAISQYGWVDGARVNYTGINDWISDVNVTVGSMKDTTDGNFWQRSWDNTPDLVQVHVRGDLSKLVKYMAEFTNFEGNDYLRGSLDIATSDILKMVDHVVLEDMVNLNGQDGANSGQRAVAVSLQKKLRGFNLTATYSDKTAALSLMDPSHMQLNDFYRQGQQVMLTVERPLRDGQIVPFFMLSKGIGDNIALGSNQQVWFQTGVKFVLKKREKSDARAPINEDAAKQ